MHSLRRLALLTAALFCPLAAAEAPRLEPGRVLRFDFPDLPPSLQSMSRGVTRSPQMSVRLPDNYTGDRTFPVFIYQTGGAGGNGDALELGLATIGPRDFVVANLPLFKATWDKNGPAGGLLVTSDDYAVIARSYARMLEHLFTAIPNLRREDSVFGGHSNGAHTTAVLLLAEDPVLLRRFPSFFLHEGGTRLITSDALETGPLRRAPVLLMMGEGMLRPNAAAGPARPPRDDAAPTAGIAPGTPARMPSGPRLLERVDALQRSRGDSFTFVRMEGYGHEQPPEYLALIGQWARREPLTDVPGVLRRLVAALPLPLRTHPDVSEWPDLLNADLSTHRLPAGNIWTYADGVLTASGDPPIWTRRDYTDCVLDFEFRPQRGADGGVLLYNSDAANPLATSIEVQLGDDGPDGSGAAATSLTGAFVGHQPPQQPAAVTVGSWNRVTIACQGPQLTVVINGAVVNRIDLARWTEAGRNPDGSEIPTTRHSKPWAQLPAKGRIGFQGRAGEPAVEFRNIKLLRLDLPRAAER